MTIKDKIQQILDSNYKEFKGLNEAELHICEDIEELIISIATQLCENKLSEEIKNYIENLEL